MSTQWEIDLIFNIWLNYIRLKLSCTINPQSQIKSKKVVAKYFLKKHAKTRFYRHFLIQ